MSLYKAELRRLGKRRVTRLTTLLGLLVLLGIAAGTFFSNQKIGPEEIAAAAREAEQAYQGTVDSILEERRRCEEARRTGVDAEQYPQDCSAIAPPTRESFPTEWYLPSTFEFRAEFESVLAGWALILALVAFVIGASFVGAEWSSGGMSNLLVWRPQRIQVLLTKLGALLTGLLGLTVLTGVAWFAAFWLIATLRGSTAGMTSGAWQSFILTGLRGVVLALVAGVVGFALASLGRNTALALGAAVAASIIGYVGVGVVLTIAEVQFVEAWQFTTYLDAWLQKKITLVDWNYCAQAVGECEPPEKDIVWQHSGVLLGAVVLITLGAALWFMRRRDVA